jgi:hypothetical protein
VCVLTVAPKTTFLAKVSQPPPHQLAYTTFEFVSHILSTASTLVFQKTVSGKIYASLTTFCFPLCLCDFWFKLDSIDGITLNRVMSPTAAVTPTTGSATLAVLIEHVSSENMNNAGTPVLGAQVHLCGGQGMAALLCSPMCKICFSLINLSDLQFLRHRPASFSGLPLLGGVFLVIV